MNDDTIRRKAAIHAMEGVDWYHINKDGQLTHGANSKDNEPLYKAEDVYKVLNDMPSAQPDLPIKEKCAFCPHCNNCDVNDNLSIQPCEDAISRQAAIDALDGEIEITGRTNAEAVKGYVRLVRDRLERLPSAQPEDCDTCKHGYFGDSHCDNCRVRYPSHYERRTDEA